MKPTSKMDRFTDTLWFQRTARGLCIVVALTLAFSPASLAKKHKASAPVLDTNYIAALSTANRFLTAWQSSDQEAALLLLTYRAKHKSSEGSIDALLHGPASRAFEIVHGRPLNRTRYQFPVVLLENTGESKQPHRKFTSIVVANTGKDDWAVDTLP